MPTKPRSSSSDAQRNARGNTRDRRRRREWLVANYRADVDRACHCPEECLPPVERGEGVPACRCYCCGALLTVDTVTVDRWPIPGCQGGRYVPGNMRPACEPCNRLSGSGLRGNR